MCHSGWMGRLSQPRLRILFGSMALVLACMGTAMAQTQSQGTGQTGESAQGGGGQPAGQVGAVGTATTVRGSSGGLYSRIVPVVTFSERYDSNVFFSPNKVSDFVTSILPGGRVEYRDDFVDGSFLGTGVLETYARHPELNYLGGNGVLTAILDKLAGRVVRGLGLTISDSVLYSPQPQAFVTPTAPPTSFLRGIQTVRNNYLTNTGNLLGTYAMTPTTQLNASYTHSIMKFFSQTYPSETGALGAALFDTTVQMISAGPEYHFSATDSLGASAVYTTMAFVPNTGVGPSSSITTEGVMMTWKSSFTRELSVEISPGISLVSSLPGKPIWTMSGTARWSEARTTASIMYTRGIYPSYFIGAGALVSSVLSASLSYNLSSQWSVSGNANYGYNESVGMQQSLRFESYDATVAANYTFYQGMTASLSVMQGNYLYGQAGSEVKFDRQTAMLYLTAEWN